jgi:hypothetical protein
MKLIALSPVAQNELRGETTKRRQYAQALALPVQSFINLEVMKLPRNYLNSAKSAKTTRQNPISFSSN